MIPQAIIREIDQLYTSYSGHAMEHLEPLAPGGGDRTYFRIWDKGKSCIATYNENIRENETFIQFSQHFSSKQIPVPAILAVNAAKTIYLQEDLGHRSLLHILEEEGYSPHVFSLYKKAVEALADMQIRGHAGMDYSACLTAHTFGKEAIMSDLLYCKYYFIDTLKMPYDKQALLIDFEKFATSVTQQSDMYFLFRDFQSRNIMVRDDAIYFIDFQGGMQGPLPYDLASLLWQAKAALPDEWKTKLLNAYLDTVDTLLPQKTDRADFIEKYQGYVLIRLIQVLGAYGFRGLFERKAHFLSSIPFALKNLQHFLQQYKQVEAFPMLVKILQAITSPDYIARFETPVAGPEAPLLVEINSFSYKKGIPADSSGNGGGYVFDCRGILNPGRIDRYKYLSGKDKPVMDYLEQETSMPDFLNSVFDIVDMHVENYLQREFSHLSINFGCTGGQHRSVYAAEQMNRHLKNKYKVKTMLQHCNEASWVREQAGIG